MGYAGVYRPITVISAPLAGAATIRVSPASFVATRDLSEIGGDGLIAGTVKVDSTPDYPVWRRVRLFKRRDGQIVREVWSDPVTGAYAFPWITRAMEFTVIAYDHTGVFNAEVRDAIVAEAMP